MANLFRDECESNRRPFGEPKPISLAGVPISLKRDHIIVGDSNAQLEEVRLDTGIFKFNDLGSGRREISVRQLFHSELANLTNSDDHSQYVHTSISRTISADHAFTGSPQFSGTVRDQAGRVGTTDQIFTSTGSGTLWKSLSQLSFTHGDLRELEDDDHLQYVHRAIARDISANHVFLGSPQFLGSVRDKNGDVGEDGQVATSTGDGFEWRTQVVENVFWVSKDGDDANDGLSPQSAKASIKAAVRASNSGLLGKLQDAAEQIFANKKLILEETYRELIKANFTFPSSTNFDLKSRQAYRLIMNNKGSIVTNSLLTVSGDPNFSNVGDKCARDAGYLVLAIANDIFSGGYGNSLEFVRSYFNTQGALIPTIFSPSSERILTIQAFTDVRERIKNVVLTGSTYLYIRQKVDRLFAFILGALQGSSLVGVPTPELQEALKRDIYYGLDELVEDVWDETFTQFGGVISSTENTCKRDIRLVAIAAAEDVGSWGTKNMIDAARSYYSGTTIFANITERQASQFAYEKLRDRIRLLTGNTAIRAHVNDVFNYIINSLQLNNVTWFTDEDAGDINKASKLCERDLGLYIDAVGSDLKNGGNVFSVEFAEAYFDKNTMQFLTSPSEVEATIEAFDKARQLMVYSMRNWRVDESGDIYEPEYSAIPVFIDGLIPDEDWPSCANAETAINNYFGIIQYILVNGPNAYAKEARQRIYESIGRGDDSSSVVNIVWEQTKLTYPEISRTEGKCKRDLILVLEAVAEDLYSVGNANTLRVIRSYLPEGGTNPIETQITQSIFAYNLARNYIKDQLIPQVEYEDVRDRVDLLFGYLTTALDEGYDYVLPPLDQGTWTVQKPSFKTTIFVNPGVYEEDNPIILPPNTVITGNSLRGITVNARNRTLDLFHVNNASGISFMTFSNHLAPSYGVAFPQKNSQGTAGIISRSPYIQQCTSITTTGGGMLVDGNLTGGFKSMVLDSYTQYNQGGAGVKIINNGYAQLVSLFTISCSTGIGCEKGGQCDLTNSNSSLGDFGLVADGVGKTEIVAKLKEDVQSGSLRFRVKLPGPLKPYNGQVGYFGAPYYAVQEIKVLDGGRGYLTVPTITITEPSGPQAIPARARATIDDGKITEITVLRSGTSFISEPSISITPPTGPDAIPATIEVVMQPIYYAVATATNIDENDETVITLTTPTLYPLPRGTSFVLSRQSKVLASGHSFEYIGAGADIRFALPIRNGTFIQQQEVEERNGGSVIFTSTDQSGNFRIGDGVIIDQATGTIGGVSFSRGLFAQVTPLILALQ